MRVSALPTDSLSPGPTVAPAIQTARWLVRPIAFMESCRRRYGDSFSVQFLGFERPMVMLSDPEAIRALYTAHEHGLPPGRTIALLPIMGPSSILLLEGREHLSRRKLMLPPFHGERMRAYETTVREVAEREIDSWPADCPFALHPSMQAVTLEVILRAVFGVTDSDSDSDRDRGAQLRRLLPLLLGDTASPALQFRVLLARRLGLTGRSDRQGRPGRPGRGDPLQRLARLIGEIDEVLLAQIAERRSDPSLSEHDDILSLLLTARFEDGTAMSDREIRDQLVTLLLAGHETTATALAWTFDLLLHYPPTLARLTAEIDAGEDAYLRAVISESLRLRPVVPLAGRRLASDLEIDGLRLPAGTDVTPAIWLTHTRADLYPEPYAFRPERFLDSPPTTYGWIPFGGGIRRCLGAAFAEMEMRIVIQAIVERAVLTPASSHPERITRRNVTFSPRHRTMVHSTRRSASPAGSGAQAERVPAAVA